MRRRRHLWRYGSEEKPHGFQVIPRRWVVDRTFAWLSRSRRLARDHERLPETGVAMIHAAMARIMLRRIAAWGPLASAPKVCRRSARP